mgnify:CR=1 FL=1
MGWPARNATLIKQVDRTKQPPEPKYELESKTLYGPYKDSVQNRAHQSMELGTVSKSDLCLNCHQSVPSAAGLGKTNDLLGNWDQSKDGEVRQRVPDLSHAGANR